MGKYLVTGAAGFIGSAVAKALLDFGNDVVGIDNFNTAYPQALKRYRVDTLLAGFPSWFMHEDDFRYLGLKDFEKSFGTFDAVIHMAGLAGVRQSVDDPQKYIIENVQGMTVALDLVRFGVAGRLVYASSSSVYGTLGGAMQPGKDDAEQRTPYAASKRMIEIMAHAYAASYGVPSSGIRFFSVYGPAGRPDSRASVFQYVRQIVEGEPTTIFGSVEQTRDFTYIGDAVRMVLNLLDRQAEPGHLSTVFNGGLGRPAKVYDVIRDIAEKVDKPMTIRFVSNRRTDTFATAAVLPALFEPIYRSSTSLSAGLDACIEWYQQNRSWAKDILP